jgi:hypothetical protein
MADTKNHTHCFDASIRVLFYKEEDSWVAHALEMDLLGYGDTTQAAMKELEKSMKSQISFAAFRDHPESIFFPAPKRLVTRWEKAQRCSLMQAVSGNKETATGFTVKASFFTLTEEQIEELRAKKASTSKPRGRGKQWEPTLAKA